MAITRTLTGFELIFATDTGPTDENGMPVPHPGNPNNLVARAILHLTMTDSSDGTELQKTIFKETHDPAKMRKWGKRILGLATGDSDGFPGMDKLDTQE